MVEDQEHQLTLRSEGTLIAVVSGLAYLIAFAYEVGYLGAFRVPLHLVQVKLQYVLVVGFCLSGVFGVLFALFNLVSMSWPKHPALQEKLLRLVIVLLFPIWQMLNYGLRKRDIPWYLFAFVLVAFFEILWPVVVFSKKGSLRERLIADEIAEFGPRSRTLSGRLRRIMGPFGYCVIMIGVLGAFLTNTAGRARAQTQEDFFLYTEQAGRRIVVVRVYPDLIIGVPSDCEGENLLPHLILRKVTPEDGLEMVFQRVGPLRVTSTSD